MATPNYSYEKRQRELAKKRKAEEKRQKKATRGHDGAPDPAEGTGNDAAPDDGTGARPSPTEQAPGN